MTNPWRKDFPILNTEVYGRKLVYLDSAATSQMPDQVSDRLVHYYAHEHANIHRGIYHLSEEATRTVENIRKMTADFIGASCSDEIIFTGGTTDSLNLAARGLEGILGEGDSVLVTDLEHHSNFIPWQQAAIRRGASLLICPSEDGELRMDLFEKILAENRVRIIAVTQVSNVTGTVMPLTEIVSLAHRYGALVILDSAQGILHEGIHVGEADVDACAFSGHKMLAPTGIGILYGKKKLLESLQPVSFGGGMVDLVTNEDSSWNRIPYRFEAGTPNIAGIAGLGAAISYLEKNDVVSMRRYEKELLTYALEKLEGIPGVKILGHPKRRSGVISFVIDGVHPYDAAFMMDKLGVAVRSGHHCAQPALRSLGYDTALRASFAFYNTKEEADALCSAVERISQILKKS